MGYKNPVPTSQETQEPDISIEILYIVFLRSVRRLIVTANVVPSSPILVTLMMKALYSSETSVLTRFSRRNIAEDGILPTTNDPFSYATVELISLSMFECPPKKKKKT
jgi:uncharacterized protein involved in exopolysaccharide biosynthesis